MTTLSNKDRSGDAKSGEVLLELSPQARRALEEAAERRRTAANAASQREIGGRGGLDPSRYGDWEVKGLASDF